LAYVSDESGRDEVYIQSFPQPGSKIQVSTSGGDSPSGYVTAANFSSVVTMQFRRLRSSPVHLRQ
jgi:hypothetical protein